MGGVTWTPALCQEFSGPQGPPDTSAWAWDLGGGGWGNNEVEIYCGPPGYPNNPPQCPASFSTATANSYVDGSGHLVIQVINSGGNWYSARLKTQGVQNFQYGRLEASIKIPNTTNPGLWPAFWWLGSDIATVPWPKCGEADIMENWSPTVLNGPGPTHDRSTIHTELSGGSGITSTYAFPAGQQADAAFYAYGVIWSANMIQFYVSPAGTQQGSLQPFSIVTQSDLQAGDTWPFNSSAFLLANVAVGGTLGGSTAGAPSGAVMMIDYVRQYTPSAPPAPVLGSPPSITVTAGATTGNTSTFTPSLAAGSGYVYFSCGTTAPMGSCSIDTDDPLNQFVVNSDASPKETVTVTVATASNASAPPSSLNWRMWNWITWRTVLLLAVAVLLWELSRLEFSRPPQQRRAGRRFRYTILFAGVILAAAVIAGCGGGPGNSGSAPAGPGSTASGGAGTSAGKYAVTVYAFTETNTGSGANASADASVTIPLAVN